MLNSQQFHTRAPDPGVPLRRNPQQFDEGVQLQMLMPAHELYNARKTTDEPSYESREDMWEQKLDESWDSGVYDSIEQSGVRTPVGVWQHGSGEVDLQHGHHRVVSAHDMDRDMEIPVHHTRHIFSGPNQMDD